MKRARLNCSFCGRTEDEVARLVAGPSVHICETCIEIAGEIIRRDKENVR